MQPGARARIGVFCLAVLSLAQCSRTERQEPGLSAGEAGPRPPASTPSPPTPPTLPGGILDLRDPSEKGAPPEPTLPPIEVGGYGRPSPRGPDPAQALPEIPVLPEIPPPPGPQKRARTDRESQSRGLFWTATKGTWPPLYLLGSVHVGTPDLYPLPAAIQAAFERSRALVVELDMTDPSTSMQAAGAMLSAGTYPPGTTAEQALGSGLWKRAARAALTVGMAPQGLSRMQPWLIAQTLAMKKLRSLGYQAHYGIDFHFLGQAKQTGKPVLTLETIGEQIRALSSMPAHTQKLMLRETLSELENLGNVVRESLEAWKRGDVDSVEDALLKQMRKPDYAPVYRALFVTRNQKMVRELKSFPPKAGPYFVVVGAGHLIGKDSMLQLLKSAGYKISRE